MVKFLQCNMNHCRAAMDLLAQFELEQQIGISIVSEPHNIPDDNTWFRNSRDTVAVHWNCHCFESAGILIRGQGLYSVAVKWRRFAVVACYISPKVDDNEYSRFLNELDSVVEELESRYTIIAGDFNAKNRMWGARITNSRGEKISRWAASKDLRLLNEGTSPTCVRHHGDSIIDLTWSTADMYSQIYEWKVLEEYTHSDHMYIMFKLRFDDACDSVNMYSVNANDVNMRNANDVNMYNMDNSVNMYRDNINVNSYRVDIGGNDTPNNACNEDNYMNIYMNTKRRKYIKWSFKKMDPEIYSETLEWKCTDTLTVNTAEEAARWLLRCLFTSR